MTIHQMLETHLYESFGYRDKRYKNARPGEGAIFGFGYRGTQYCYATLSAYLDAVGDVAITLSQGFHPTPEILNALHGWTRNVVSSESRLCFSFSAGNFQEIDRLVEALSIPHPDPKCSWNFARKELQDDFGSLQAALSQFFATLHIPKVVREAITEEATKRSIGLENTDFVAGAISEADGCGYFVEDFDELGAIAFEGEQVLFHFPFRMTGESRNEDTMWHPIAGVLILSVPWDSVQAGNIKGVQAHASSHAAPEC